MSVTYPVFSFDLEGYKRALTAHVIVVLQNAIKLFIRKAVSKVPVDYGMARGTFLSLAQVLGETVPIVPKPHKYIKFYKQTGKPRVQREPESGRLFATVFGTLSDVIKVQGDEISFEFTNDLLYYYLNEYGLVYGPWESFETGKQELLNYFNSNILIGSPDLADFVIVTHETR